MQKASFNNQSGWIRTWEFNLIISSHSQAWEMIDSLFFLTSFFYFRVGKFDNLRWKPPTMVKQKEEFSKSSSTVVFSCCFSINNLPVENLRNQEIDVTIGKATLHNSGGGEERGIFSSFFYRCCRRKHRRRWEKKRGNLKMHVIFLFNSRRSQACWNSQIKPIMDQWVLLSQHGFVFVCLSVDWVNYPLPMEIMPSDAVLLWQH